MVKLKMLGYIRLRVMLGGMVDEVCVGVYSRLGLEMGKVCF